MNRPWDESSGAAFRLRSGAFPLDTSADRLGALRPSELIEGVSTLRSRFQREGYVWIRNLLPANHVLAFRRFVFQQMQAVGLVSAGTDPLQGLDSAHQSRNHFPRIPFTSRLAALRQERIEAGSQRKLMQLVRSKEYEEFCQHPQLLSFLSRFLGGPLYLHQRKIIRLIRPKRDAATGAHYDRIYLRGGTDQFLTTWIPLGDIPVEMGGLVYLENSQAWARCIEAAYHKRNSHLQNSERIQPCFRRADDGGWMTRDLRELADRLNSRWLVARYSVGDVVLHSPYVIHASTNNDDVEGRIRLATDLRFQRSDHSIDRRWSNHWAADDGL